MIKHFAISVVLLLVSFFSLKAQTCSPDPNGVYMYYAQLKTVVPDSSFNQTSLFNLLASSAYNTTSKYNALLGAIDSCRWSFPLAVSWPVKSVISIYSNDASIDNSLDYSDVFNYVEKVCYFSNDSSRFLGYSYIPDDLGNLDDRSHLELINAPGAWSVTKGDPSIIIGIADTYIYRNHEDLQNKIVNLIPNNNPNVDKAFHGSLVAGAAAAETDNALGISSVGFNTSIYFSAEVNDAEMLKMAQLPGIKVLNASWISSCVPFITMENLYNEIRDVHDVLIVAAAGNDTTHCSDNAVVYPAGYESVISVTSVGHRNPYGYTDALGQWNWKDCHEETIGGLNHHHNDKVNISAPGYRVKSTGIDGGYRWTWGTSFASPIVAGAAALVFAANPCLKAIDVQKILYASADSSIYNLPCNANYQGLLGSGRLDVEAAVNLAQNYIRGPISSNTLWDSDEYVAGDLFIESGGTLTITSTVRLEHNARIVVRQGGKLIVDGGTLTNVKGCGDHYWYGVDVLGTPGSIQSVSSGEFGYAEFKNGAVVERAVYGVRNYNRGIVGIEPPGEYGGIIRAYNSSFVNNINSVYMRDHKNYIPQVNLNGNDLSIFRNCVFINDGADQATGHRNHVDLRNVHGIKFEGCDFINTSSLPAYGILAIDAGFSVLARKTGSTFDRSYFEGMDFAINVDNTGTSESFRVDRADFEKINTAIRFKGTQQVSILRSNIELGNPPFNHGLKRGIWVQNSSGFEIMENTITRDFENSYGSSTRHGIWIAQSGTNNNEIYKNTISEVQYAVPTKYVNRGVETFGGSNFQYKGLQILCNDFNANDFDILSLDDYTGIYPQQSEYGIRKFQSVEDNNTVYSAGNEFDLNASGAFESSFKVETPQVIDYYAHTSTNRGVPFSYTQNMLSINSNSTGSQSYLKLCPSKLSTKNNPNDPYQENQSFRAQLLQSYNALDTAHANLYYSYNQMIDGGSTPSLLVDIQNEWSDDAWEMRNELLAKSPLSEEALLEAAFTGILPDALLLEVCIANSDITQNEDILNILQYEIPNTLDQNAIGAIINSWNQETVIGSLERQLSGINQQMSMLKNNLIKTILFDSSGVNLDSLEKYQMLNATTPDLYNHALIKANHGDLSTSLDILSSIQSSLPENDYLMDEYERYNAWINQLAIWDASGKNIHSLDSSDILTLESYAYEEDQIGAIAYAILKHDFGYPILQDSLNVNSSAKLGRVTNQLFEDHLKIYPNPGNEQITIELYALAGNNVLLSVYDVQGRLIESHKVKDYQKLYLLRTDAYEPGHYLLKCSDITGKQLQGKFSIIR